MTLGEKIQAARSHAGMTQQQLATKLTVSRQAVTKWENDSGIPDIQNLKALAALFDVSVDYLVAGDEAVSGRRMRQPINLDDYRPKSRSRALAVQALYPKAAAIHELLRTRRRTPLEWVMEFLVDVDFVRAIDSVDKYAAHFLVDLGDRQLIATVKRDCIESEELTEPWDGRGTLLIGTDKFWRSDRTLQNSLRI
ncbi:MAG: helix-turn-helix transcriptional regulator [Micropruina sp.]|uniref:helix-turn-helix domain-containing protein n=1 Tax=Micropruina sp. TaxID=2737536 RepID=UPI0039E599F7